MKYFLTIFFIFLISFSSCHRPTHTSSVTYLGYNETPVDNSPISVKYDTVRSMYMLVTDKDTIEKCKVIYGTERILITSNRAWVLYTYYDKKVRQTKTDFSYTCNYPNAGTFTHTSTTTNNLVCSTNDYTTIMIGNKLVNVHVLKCLNNKCYYTFMNDTVVYVANSKDLTQLSTPFEADSLEYQPFDIVLCTDNCE